MDLPDSSNQRKLSTLQQAAQKLSVSVDALLEWNNFNILKPAITEGGEIGYSQEQIDKFLAIQQLLQSNKIDHKRQETAQQTSSNKLFPVVLTLSFSAIIIAIIFATFIRPGKFKLLPELDRLISQKETGDTGEILASQINKPNLSESTPLSIQTEDKISSGNNHKNADYTSLKGKFEGIDFASSRLNQAQVLGSKFDKNSETNIQNDINFWLDNIGYSEIANSSENVDETHNLFDDSGNIKGKTKGTDILGMALGITRMIQDDNPLKPTANSYVMLTFTVLGSISIFFVLKKQFAFSTTADALAVSTNFSGNTGKQRILEVDQKMDGTVVLYFQGKEYKLSKPELDSESDQFIERLMELSHPDLKEINYDSLHDENLKLSAPLSKLVTRLGFVGIKRDLFFPRTSKNRVLFRRYITEQDLISMNLNTSQISNELFQ
jgi:hypothetical protein